MRRLRGESDMEIQHAARWTSTKQLKTYDLSSQEDAFKLKLAKRGLIPAIEAGNSKTRRCDFCETMAGFQETICQQCKRPLDRNAIRRQQKENDRETRLLREELGSLKEHVQDLRKLIMPRLAEDLLENGQGRANGKSPVIRNG